MERLRRRWQSRTRRQKVTVLISLAWMVAVFATFVVLALWVDPLYWIGVYLSPVVLAFVAFLVIYEQVRKRLIALFEAYGRRRQRHDGPGLLVLAVFALLFPQTAAGQNAVTADSLVVGVAHEGRPLMTAVPYASGAWGTDYLTVSHGMRMGGLKITFDGRRFDAARYVTVCSGMVHGIEALILRVVEHRNRPTATWGDHMTLKPGDELQVLPWHGLHGPRTVRLLGHSFRQWIGGSEDWPTELDHALVAEGRSDPGGSGAPWVRNGRVYGVHKGAAKIVSLSGGERIVALAEPATRIRECLTKVGYSVPE